MKDNMTKSVLVLFILSNFPLAHCEGECFFPH